MEDYVVAGMAIAVALLVVIGIFRKPGKTDWWAQYNRYLKSPEWQTKRQAVIRRAEGRCEICGMRKPIQVHHLKGSYARIPNEEPWDLAALCFDCHEAKHGLNRQCVTLFDKRKRHHP